MPHKTARFVSSNPAAALEQIRRELGPEAVVVSVRRLPAHGVSRLWQRNGPVEVFARVPDSPLPPPSPSHKPRAPGIAPPTPAVRRDAAHLWPGVARLQTLGLWPEFAGRLQTYLNSRWPKTPATRDAECKAIRAGLADFWPPARSRSGPKACCAPHVFVGPPGSGKTTALCKWLTLAVLTEERSARVWRLDGAGANTADFLTVHCETLGVPVERFWSQPAGPDELCFVDLPGVDAGDRRAQVGLRRQLAALGSPEVHLVLNAAYETDLLLEQCRAFAELEPADLVLTHLDEETRVLKLWNVVFGTKCTLRYLGAGQKIPGEFLTASPILLMPPEIG